MKFSLAWLRSHLDTDADLARIAATLDAIGLEVEGIEDRAAALAPFRIARVIEAAPHPNADRLRACRVDTGDGEISVVCGAPNVRSGMKAVFAPPDSFIPGTGITLKAGEIRGVRSAGMLLSAREMGLGDDHSGIVELPADAPVGAAYAGWAGLDDPVIEIAVTPNRGDALAVRGVARDLAAAGLGRLRPWDPAPVPGGFASPVAWRIDWQAACPWVLGRTIRSLRNGASPKWLADRLTAIGLRPINALVDITNFFTVDLGRPLHVFDVAKLAGGALVLRRGEGETFRALNGRDVGVTPEDCVIADAAGVQSLAGIVGGEASGCDADTTTVFIECALFDPVRVALTGRRQQIASDARARFERGVDPALPPRALEAATQMILDLCGGEASTVVAAGAEPDWRRSATLRFARLASLGGAAVPPDEATSVLARLGFGIEARDEESGTVAVPSWRNDIAQAEAVATEAEADLVEEVLRLRGLDAIPPVSMPRAAVVPAPSVTPRRARAALARRVLAARGLAECVTFSFTGAREAALFGPTPPSLRLLNPIAADLDQMRPSPLATLALAARQNAARGLADCAVFEIGPAFREDAADRQTLLAAGLRTGAAPRNWLAASRPVDAFDAKADVLALLGTLGIAVDSLGVTSDVPAHYHPGRAGVLRQGPKTVLAWFGELHPRVLAALDLAGPAVAFEMFLDAVPEPKRRRKAPPELSPLQPVRRDFAFVVGPDVTAESVLRVVRGAERGLIAGVSLFDVYAGSPLAAGERSLGVEVVLQPRAQTLTDAEIEAVSARIVVAVTKATGARLR